MKRFNLPDPGEGLVEAEIITWHVKPGDEVKVNDVLVEIETSKSLVELPSPWAGRVTELLVPEGETVEVGTPIIEIDDGSGEAAPSKGDADESGQQAGDDESADAGEKRVPVLVGYGASAGRTRRRARKRPADPEAAEVTREASRAMDTSEPVGFHSDTAQVLDSHRKPSHPRGRLPSPGQASSSTTSMPTAPQHVRAKPPVRKLAKDLGVDLASITPSGAGGIVTRDDVHAAAQGSSGAQGAGETPAAAPRRAASLGGEEVRVPIKGVRKHTAAAMVASAFTAPHVTEWVEVDVTAGMELLARLRERREFRDIKLSPTVLVARAVCLAAQATPEVNASWDEDAQEIVLHPHVNLGIAAATPRGLVVPNIKGAETLGLKELAEELAELVTTARAGRTQPADMSGGTMTITNIGVFDVDGGTPILNPGEAMIVATGRIMRRPWVVGSGADERIEARDVMTLSCSFDHRLVDGEQGSRFLARVAALLCDPALAMI
ncbi:dihydrolipoamide acetyltransferase family protein [Propioniferax innocua]|uniref:Dihydrolipoamide acetyltransferase component of pyruvate dehydrogenase complex n=1 Tax=Propioniferax innocua TaxID=1753 RepID=A0A542ZDI7_9ACTN|nr:dihydrolipoamide acetyltransferase family protein [Propioniferax innocua]TQL58361.1 pyruvate dehydrogenase E2 component (dihydrolipoamide acetyltransferase) [Propioniferax innocua]